MQATKLFAVLFAMLFAIGAIGTVFAEEGRSDGTDDNPSADDLAEGVTTATDTSGSGSDAADDSATDDSDGRIRERALIRTETADGRTGFRQERGELAGQRLELRQETREEFKTLHDERKLRLEERREIRGNGTLNLTPAQFAGLSEEEREALREQFKAQHEQLREDYKERVEEIKTQFKGRAETLREEFKQNRERLGELREQHEERRSEFSKAKDELKGSCRNLTSANCTRARERLNDDARNFMGSSAEQMLRIIESVKAKVTTDPDVDSAASAELAKLLDEHTAAITAAQAKIDALTNESDINTTRAAADALRTAWQESRVTIRLAEGLLEQARMQQLLNDLTAVASRAQEFADKLEAAGKDTAAFEADIAAFNAKIAAGQASLDDITDAYIDAMGGVTDDEGAKTLVQTTRDALKDVKDELKDSRDLLRSVVADLRALEPGAIVEIAKTIREQRSADDAIELEVEA
jgi:chromosome segregation ATPase